ncbi:MAG: hypothetical protein NC299_14735 [Lachnospiraceae bacterium]|nr:hypothetical protein [Ruminococcus sp.]MCM1276593.1 hypothetical protein [Lachnospiraceae bacterium]
MREFFFFDDHDKESLRKFLELEKPWEYDFTFAAEYENPEPTLSELKALDTYERWLTLAACRPMSEKDAERYPKAKKFADECAEKYGRLRSPDGSPDASGRFYRLPQKIYDTLWGWRRYEDERYGSTVSFGNKFACDTMNTVERVLCELYGHMAAAQLPNDGDISFGHLLECSRTTDNFLGELTDIFAGMGMKEYVESCRTLGNFVLVPEGFEEYRAANFGGRWDTSLENIRITQLSEKKFRKYVNVFFLWDYTRAADSRYTVRETRPDKPSEIDKITNPDAAEKIMRFLFRLACVIKRRGVFMTAMALFKLADIREYEALRFDLAYDGYCFNDMSEAARFVLNEYEKSLPTRAAELLSKLTLPLYGLDDIAELCKNGAELEFIGENEEFAALEYAVTRERHDGGTERIRFLTAECMDDVDLAAGWTGFD